MARLDWPIWFLALSQTIIWAGIFYIFPALLVKWEADLGWSKTALTAAFAAATLTAALFSPPAGRLIDRGGGPGLLAGGGLAGGVLIGLMSFVDSYALFFGLWVLIGATFSACLYEPCFALVTRARGAAARRSITLITLVAGFAGTLSFPLAHVISEAAGWRMATLAFAGLICLVGVPLAWFGGRRLEAEAGGRPESLPRRRGERSRSFLSNPAFWLLTVAFGLLAVNHGIVLHHFLPILAERAVPDDLAVLAASMIGPMQVAGRLVMIAVERHVTSAAITIGCFVAVVVAVLCLIGAAALPLLVIGFVVLHGSGNGVTSIMKPVVTRDILGERNFGAITGAMAAPVLAAGAVAPFFGSLLWELGGYSFALWTTLAVSVAGLVCYLAADRIHRYQGIRPD